MPRRDWKFRIRDILDAIDKIEQYTSGMTREAFGADSKTIDAVVRNIAVIGEAARHVPGEIQASHSDLPWADMRDMRNVVVHQYFGVDVDVLWETIQRDLPPLVARLGGIVAGKK